jgi:hypothetical protein
MLGPETTQSDVVNQFAALMKEQTVKTGRHWKCAFDGSDDPTEVAQTDLMLDEYFRVTKPKLQELAAKEPKVH